MFLVQACVQDLPQRPPRHRGPPAAAPPPLARASRPHPPRDPTGAATKGAKLPLPTCGAGCTGRCGPQRRNRCLRILHLRGGAHSVSRPSAENGNQWGKFPEGWRRWRWAARGGIGPSAPHPRPRFQASPSRWRPPQPSPRASGEERWPAKLPPRRAKRGAASPRGSPRPPPPANSWGSRGVSRPCRRVAVPPPSYLSPGPPRRAGLATAPTAPPLPRPEVGLATHNACGVILFLSQGTLPAIPFWGDWKSPISRKIALVLGHMGDTGAQDFLLPTHAMLGDHLGLTSQTPAVTGLGKDLSSNLKSCHLRRML
ncbi:uncharacterized protein AAES06_024296 [Glossophaga mutica]